MSEEYDIEKLIKEQFLNEEIIPSPNLFEKIEHDYRKRKRKRFGFMLFIALAFTLTTTVILNYKSDENSNKENAANRKLNSNEGVVEKNIQFDHFTKKKINSTMHEIKPNKTENIQIDQKNNYNQLSNNVATKQSEFQKGNSDNNERIKSKSVELNSSNKLSTESNVYSYENAISLADQKNKSFINIISKSPNKYHFDDSIQNIEIIAVSKNQNIDSNKLVKTVCCEDCNGKFKEPMFFVGLAYHFIELKTEEMYLMTYVPKTSGSFQVGFKKAILKRQVIPNVALEISYFQNYLKYEDFYKIYYDNFGKQIGGGGNWARIEYRDQLNLSIPVGIDFRSLKVGRFNVLLGGGIKFNFIKNYHAIDPITGPFAQKGKTKISGKDYSNYYSAFFAKAEIEYSTAKFRYSVFTTFHQNALLFESLHFSVDKETVKIKKHSNWT